MNSIWCGLCSLGRYLPAVPQNVHEERNMQLVPAVCVTTWLCCDGSHRGTLGLRVSCSYTLRDLILQFSLFPTSVPYNGVSETYSTVESGWIVKTLNHGNEKFLAWLTVC
jgi:hypothetical protein